MSRSTNASFLGLLSRFPRFRHARFHLNSINFIHAFEMTMTGVLTTAHEQRTEAADVAVRREKIVVDTESHSSGHA